MTVQGSTSDLAERVFLPHERGLTSAPGAGLGLAIARGIVDAHRGTIGLELVGRGTSVAVVLPVEPVDLAGGAMQFSDVDAGGSAAASPALA